MSRVLALLALAVGLAAVDSATRPHVVIATDRGAIVCELFADQAPATVANFLALAEGATRPATGATGAPFYDGLTFHRVIPGFMIQGGCPRGDGSGGPGYAIPDEINAASLGLDREKAIVDGQRLHPQCEYLAERFAQVELRPRLERRGIGPGTPQDQLQAALGQVIAELAGLTLQGFYEDLGYRYDPALPPSTPPVRGVLAMANSGPATNGSQFFITVADTPHLTGKHTVFGRVVEGMAVADAIAGVPTEPRSNRPLTPVVIRQVRRAPGVETRAD